MLTFKTLARSLLRTLWDKKKMLIYPIKEDLHLFSHTDNVVYKCSEFGQD